MKCVIALGILLALPAASWPQQAGLGRRLYLLTASPTIYGPVTYPADLYTIAENGKLQLVRHVVPAEDGVDFVLSSSDALVVAHPHISPTAFEIIHYDDPGSADPIAPSLGQRSVMGGFVVTPPGRSMVALDLSSPAGQIPAQTGLIGIDIQRPDSGQRVIDPLPWGDVEYARIQGEAGGPLEGRSAHLAGTLTNDGWIRNTPQGPVSLVPYSSTQPAALTNHVEALRCANDRFSVFAVSAETQAETLPGSRSQYRLFGSWLAVLVVESATGHTAEPGAGLQRKIATAALPSVAEGYADAMRVEGKWLPGVLELVNLESHVVIQWNTGQADSEILGVSGNEVLYRVNYQILEAPVAGGQLGKSVLLADDENVPEVHWAFWSTN